MRREEFDHVIWAAGTIADDEIVAVGSQAILAQHPDAPATLLTSMEVDLYPRSQPERAEEIDGAIGDGSQFHAMYGYYGHGVGPETVTGPRGWEDRLVKVEVHIGGRTVVGWALESHDLVIAKLGAGRPHDREYAVAAIQEGLVDAVTLRSRVELMPDRLREATRERLEGALARASRPTTR